MRGCSRLKLWHVLHTSFRGFSSAPEANVDKNLLSKLRKQTGIPFINCKKALTKFNNDYDQAKKWLLEEAQKEGWARATKLQARPMSQGLVAVVGDTKSATMIEVNCETDFVARNEKFVAMVTKLVQECSVHFDRSTEAMVSATKDDLNKITTAEQTSLADIVALNVGNLGENMALRRGVFLRANEGCVLSAYVHPSGSGRSNKSVLLGKYGALVEMKPNVVEDKPVMNLDDLGHHLCQHIVGMNPKAIGVYAISEKEATDNTKNSIASGKEDSGYLSDLSSDADSTLPVDIEEDNLLQQEFLLDTSMTVGELLRFNGVDVLQFSRFACGEELEGEGER